MIWFAIALLAINLVPVAALLGGKVTSKGVNDAYKYAWCLIALNLLILVIVHYS